VKQRTIQLTGLTNDEQRKLDSRLTFELFRLQEKSSLDTVLTGLMTVNGEGSVLAPQLRGKYGSVLEVNYAGGNILTYSASASVIYQLAKDPCISSIELAGKMQLSTE